MFNVGSVNSAQQATLGSSYHCGCVYSNAKNTAYVFGGFINGKLSNVLYTFKNGLKRLEAMRVEGECPCPRYLHSMNMNEKEIYVYGGKAADGRILNDLWLFSLVSGKWYQIQFRDNSFPFLYGHCCVYHEKCLYVIGGESNTTKNPVYSTNVISLYMIDLETENVIALSSAFNRNFNDMNQFGHEKGQETSILLPNYGYQRVNQSFRSINAPCARTQCYCFPMAEYFILFGGIQVDDAWMMNDIWYYYYVKKRWECIQSVDMRYGCIRGESVCLYHDCLIVYGGIQPSSEAYTKAYMSLYSLKEKQWIPSEPMPYPCWCFHSAFISNKSILTIIGGIRYTISMYSPHFLYPRVSYNKESCAINMKDMYNNYKKQNTDSTIGSFKPMSLTLCGKENVERAILGDPLDVSVLSINENQAESAHKVVRPCDQNGMNQAAFPFNCLVRSIPYIPLCRDTEVSPSTRMSPKSNPTKSNPCSANLSPREKDSSSPGISTIIRTPKKEYNSIIPRPTPISDLVPDQANRYINGNTKSLLHKQTKSGPLCSSGKVKKDGQLDYKSTVSSIPTNRLSPTLCDSYTFNYNDTRGEISNHIPSLSDNIIEGSIPVPGNEKRTPITQTRGEEATFAFGAFRSNSDKSLDTASSVNRKIEYIYSPTPVPSPVKISFTKYMETEEGRKEEKNVRGKPKVIDPQEIIRVFTMIETICKEIQDVEEGAKQIEREITSMSRRIEERATMIAVVHMEYNNLHQFCRNSGYNDKTIEELAIIKENKSIELIKLKMKSIHK